MLIQLSPVISDDEAPARRCVRSCVSQPSSHKDINFLVHALVAPGAGADRAAGLCRELGVAHSLLASSNCMAAAMDNFLLGPADGLSMLWQRDFLYPGATVGLANHLSQFIGTDFLVTKAVDVLARSPVHEADPNFASVRVGVSEVLANCCTTHRVDLGYRVGPGKRTLLPDGSNLFVSTGRHLFYSRRFAAFAAGGSIQALEEVRLEIEGLRLHQMGRVAFWQAYMSDFLVEDWLSGWDREFTECDLESSKQVLDHLLKSLPENRSSHEELPVAFPDIRLDIGQKISFLEKELAW